MWISEAADRWCSDPLWCCCAFSCRWNAENHQFGFVNDVEGDNKFVEGQLQGTDWDGPLDLVE